MRGGVDSAGGFFGNEATCDCSGRRSTGFVEVDCTTAAWRSVVAFRTTCFGGIGGGAAVEKETAVAVSTVGLPSAYPINCSVGVSFVEGEC